MTELEPYAEDFIRAANTLIRRAVAHEPRIKEAVTVDATGFETHARLNTAALTRRRARRLAANPRNGRGARTPMRSPSTATRTPRTRRQA